MENNQEKNKRIAKNTLLLYVRMFLMMGVSLYTSRVILQALGVEDYGIYNVVGGFISLFSFLNGAMAAATQRYLNFEIGQDNLNKLQNVFINSINIHLTISIIILFFSETLGLWFFYNYLTIPNERLNAAFWVYQCSILSTVFLVMSVPYNACIIAHEKMKAFAYISVLEVCLKLLIAYAITIGHFDRLKLYAILMLFIQTSTTIIYRIYCKKKFKETKYKWLYDKNLFKEMCSFAGWNLFGNIAVVAMTQGVNVVLNIFFGPSINAARGISVQVQGAIQTFCRNFQTAVNPQITKSYAKEDFTYMHNLIFASSKFSVFLLLIITLPIFIRTEYIINLWLVTPPEKTVNFLKIILIIAFIDIIANPLMQSILATGRIKRYQIIVGFAQLTILPLSYIAIKITHYPEIAFIIHLFIAILCQYLRLIFIRKAIKLHIKEYFTNVILPIIKVCIPTVIITYFINQYIEYNIIGLCLFALLSCIITILCIFFLGLKEEEIQYAKKIYLYEKNKISIFRRN